MRPCPERAVYTTGFLPAPRTTVTPDRPHTPRLHNAMARTNAALKESIHAPLPAAATADKKPVVGKAPPVGAANPKGAKKRKYRRGSARKFGKEVRDAAKRTKNVLPRATTARLVREIATEVTGLNVSFAPDALEVLREAAQAKATELMKAGYAITINRGEITLRQKDMKLAAALLDVCNPRHSLVGGT